MTQHGYPARPAARPGPIDTLTRRDALSGMAAMSALAVSLSASAARTSVEGARGEYLIKGACALSMDPQIGDLPQCDIHVRAGEIVQIAPQITAGKAGVIDARGMIAIPGLIDTHWHMWASVARNMAGETPDTGYFPFSRVLGTQFSPEDNARGVRLALAEALHGGLTTVHNWSHNLLSPAYADAELDAHRTMGVRALFGYGYSRKSQENETLPFADILRIQRDWLPRLDGLVTLGIAARGPEYNPMDICEKEWGFARDHGLRISTHMAISEDNFERVRAVMALEKAGLLGPDVLLVHNTYFGEAELAALAGTRTPLSLSPFTELRTGFGITPINILLKAGVPVSLSVDTTVLSGNGDMFAIMKVMQNIGDGLAQNEFALSARRVLEMATIDGARALGLDDRIGSLTPGKRADIVLVDTRDLNMVPFTDPARMVVQSAQPANVDTVLVDGRIMKRHRKLTAVDTAKLRDDANETIDRIRRGLKLPNPGAVLR